MQVELEKYNDGRGRHTCPSCGRAKQFTRYINAETDKPFDDRVGICNRVGKCGYNYPPRMFFADNPQFNNAGNSKPNTKKKSPKTSVFVPPPVLTFHNASHLKMTLGNNSENPFLKYLSNLFPDCEKEIENVANKYFIGSHRFLTCFWQIDRKGRICKGKLIRYDEKTGNRQFIYRWEEKNEKTNQTDVIEIKTYWMHRILQKKDLFAKDVNLKSCFFGEHLLEGDKTSTICLVEAEKTAIIAALCFPEYLWLAVGAQSHLTADRMSVLVGRDVIFYPDADAFALWQKKAAEARVLGINAQVSTFIDALTTDQEKEDGFDLADFIHREQTLINIHNDYTEFLNQKIDLIIENADLFNRFEELCAEREAILDIPEKSLPKEEIRRIVENCF